MRLPFLALALAFAVLPAAAQDNFNLEDTVAICAACHGEDGVPDDPEIPIIWGQQYFYIYTQLRDFAAGRREQETMTPIASELTRDQAKQVAQYFAEKNWPYIQVQMQEGDAHLAEVAMSIAECSACHGKWQGDSRIPRLAGQQVAYLARVMHEFKAKTRMNAPDMANIMVDVPDEGIEALARYLGATVIH